MLNAISLLNPSRSCLSPPIFLTLLYTPSIFIMKIATYNVNGVNGRLPVLLRWLQETTPDIVCLQELKAPQEKFPEQAIKDAGYNALWHGQKSWNGVAILARDLPLNEVRRALPDNNEDVQSRYIEATVN